MSMSLPESVSASNGQAGLSQPAAEILPSWLEQVLQQSVESSPHLAVHEDTAAAVVVVVGAFIGEDGLPVGQSLSNTPWILG